MWAAPVIAVSSAAPAFAASSMPIFTSSTYRHFDTGTATTCGTGAQFSIEQNAGVGFLKVDGLLAGDVLSKLSTTFYVALPAGVTWTRTGSSCWTTPVESTALNMTVGGILYRAYTTTFTCSLTYTGSTYLMPEYQFLGWRTPCITAGVPSLKEKYTQTITVTRPGEANPIVLQKSSPEIV